MSFAANNFKISEPDYFYREYKNDLPQEESGNYYLDQCKRITSVALPFLSLYKPFGFTLSLTLGGLRSFASFSHLLSEIQYGSLKGSIYTLIQAALSIIALAGTILAHPLGMLITTVHDCAIDSFSIGQNLYNGDFINALGSSANLINNTLYLTLFFYGGLEIAVASVAMQILIGLSHSASEYQKGNYLEAGGHILMGMIRANQLIDQGKMLKMKWLIESDPNFINEIENISKMDIRTENKSENISSISELPSDFKVSSSITSTEQIQISRNVALNTKKFSHLPSHQTAKLGASPSNKPDIGQIIIDYTNNPNGWPAICYAAHLGNEDVVKILIDCGANINSQSSAGFPLDFALKNKNASMINFLIKNGANCFQEGLISALRDSYIEGLEILKSSDLLNSRMTGDHLWEYLEKGISVDSLNFLIKNGADCKYRKAFYHQDGDLLYFSGLLTPAVAMGNLEVVKILIKNGAPVNENLTRMGSNNPLTMSVFGNKTEIAKALIEGGAKLPPHQGTRNSLVQSAVLYNKNDEMLLMMIGLGQTVDTLVELPPYGICTPLNYAIRQQNTELARKMLEKGANHTGCLKIALEQGNKTLVDLLLKHGATIDGIQKNAPDTLGPQNDFERLLERYEVDEVDQWKGLTSPLEKALWLGETVDFMTLKQSGKFPQLIGPLNIRYNSIGQVYSHYMCYYKTTSWKTFLWKALLANDINAMKFITSKVAKETNVTIQQKQIQSVISIIENADFWYGRVPYESLKEASKSVKIPVFFYKYDIELIEIGLNAGGGSLIYTDKCTGGTQKEMLTKEQFNKHYLQIESNDSAEISSKKKEIYNLLNK